MIDIVTGNFIAITSGSLVAIVFWIIAIRLLRLGFVKQPDNKQKKIES
ncbi:MAG TPA: hypothetical protein VJH34_02915 [archaeon]|nr:hypothetical protein [archaeon]